MPDTFRGIRAFFRGFPIAGFRFLSVDISTGLPKIRSDLPIRTNCLFPAFLLDIKPVRRNGLFQAFQDLIQIRVRSVGLSLKSEWDATVDMSPRASGQLGDIMGLMIGYDVALDRTELYAEFGCNLSMLGCSLNFSWFSQKSVKLIKCFIDGITNIT